MILKKIKILVTLLLTLNGMLLSSQVSASPSLSMSIEEIAAILSIHKLITLPKKNHSIVKPKKQLTVTASAYTSHVNQTDSTPNIAAWGDRLSPGMKVIAVSRDLLHKYGLKHKQKVRIKGLKGHYLVLDKMNKRWKKRIDIYMGYDLKKAFKWGKKKVTITW